MRTRIWMIGLVALLSAVALQAQSGVIAGTVRDSSGGVLPGVTVEVRSPALVEGVRSTVTGSDGRYRLLALPAGTYEVRFTLPAFSSMRREGIVVAGDVTTMVDAELQIGAITEEVVVTAEAPTFVDVRSAQRRVDSSS